MFERFLPKEAGFFDFFEQHSRLSIAVCRQLDAIALNPSELAVRYSRIKEIEHEADDITHKCIDALHRTFITPIDRGDIYQLIRRLDDIVDSIDATASRMTLYEMTEMRPELKQFTEILIKATTELERSVVGLRHLNRDGPAIQKSCIAISDAENEADRILRSALARLFKEEPDPVLIIQWKEIFERLEKAVDRCEDVANIVEGVVIEAS
jgi:predicted phosphate transport protein (TIGR00153 family)